MHKTRLEEGKGMGEDEEDGERNEEDKEREKDVKGNEKENK